MPEDDAEFSIVALTPRVLFFIWLPRPIFDGSHDLEVDGGLGESPRNSVPSKTLPPWEERFATPPLAFVIVLLK